eukprot:SAG11_NODE_6627_length_1277_cov_1.256367_1_plen_163_part_00
MFLTELRKIKEAAAMREETDKAGHEDVGHRVERMPTPRHDVGSATPASASPMSAVTPPASAVAVAAAETAKTVHAKGMIASSSSKQVPGQKIQRAAENVSVEPSVLSERAIDKAAPATKADARTVFTALLNDKDVKGSWSWPQAMSAIITDPRYNILKVRSI